MLYWLGQLWSAWFYWSLCWTFVFRIMDKLAKHLDPSRLAITEAMWGVLLAAQAVQLMLDGLADLHIIELAG